MIAHVTIGGRTLRVELRRRAGGGSTVLVDGRPVEVDAMAAGPFQSLVVDGRNYDLGVERRGSGLLVEWPAGSALAELTTGAAGEARSATRASAGPARIVAPMPGKVVRVLVELGQDVPEGGGLLVVDAMKMENELRSPRAGRVLELPAREGQAVEAGALLAIVG